MRVSQGFVTKGLAAKGFDYCEGITAKGCRYCRGEFCILGMIEILCMKRLMMNLMSYFIFLVMKSIVVKSVFDRHLLKLSVYLLCNMCDDNYIV